MRGINHGPRTRHHVPHENIEIDRERETECQSEMGKAAFINNLCHK